MRRITFLFAAALLALSASLTVAGEATKSQSAKSKSSNEAAYGGYCPVAYAAMNKAVKGDPKQSLTVNGHKVLFANADAKKMYQADPAKYRVAYQGWCATAVAMGKMLKSDPVVFTVSNGVTYLFSSADAKKMFDGDVAMMVKNADAQWKSMGH